MARLSTAELNDRKETTTKKKAAAKAKNPSNGVWPCEMNGCNKQFAREADLKRHQRTTKLHSMGGFACPQCEANFTRTDALRRHQKSRHNGVVYDPIESENSGESSQNGGAVVTVSKGNGEAVMPETVQGTPSTSGPATGHSSYYRESVRSGSYAPPPRTAGGTEWSHGHPWPNGNAPPPLGQTAYMYIPPPFFRHDTSDDADPHTGNLSSPSSSSSQSQRNEGEESVSPISHSSRAASIPAPIPPLPPPVQLVESLLLDAEGTRTIGPSSSEHQCSQEGFSHNALMKHSRTWSMSDEADMSGEESSHGNLSASTSSSSSVTSGESPVSKGSHIMREHGYGSRLVRPEPLEPILTENGEPMLDPAELLTQESLASPEPSL
ncbi:hypothetical protein GGU10DRAFT_364309 [Lentinula aff. detonsa]|uniref:C2H2-type domain-containing protein n=1 Tax=Lentinula aff. detonsa TaxID=2804958 RepID=A0AA38KCP1_9AGAR|nr:hypothetical protein GGU10DRAFT_364309 [Lentinula aff. detonsa]